MPSIEKKRRVARAQEFNIAYRRAFFTVLETYNELRSTMGKAKALDYHDSQLGKAKYKNDMSFLKLMDFVIDVEKAVKDTLETKDLTIFHEVYQDELDSDVYSTVEQLAIQARLGRIFVGRGLYPVSKYFLG